MARSFFEIFGVEAAYHVDLAALEKRFFELSKELHPDRAPKAERLAAMQRTTELNDAWRVIKDERKRAEYLCKLGGVDLSNERAVTLDQETLVELLERNEAVDEAHGNEPRLRELQKQAESDAAATWAQVEARFRGDWRATVRELAHDLVLMRYHARLLEAVSTALGEAA
jgi:molecular chaperone HscB